MGSTCVLRVQKPNRYGKGWGTERPKVLASEPSEANSFHLTEPMDAFEFSKSMGITWLKPRKWSVRAVSVKGQILAYHRSQDFVCIVKETDQSETNARVEAVIWVRWGEYTLRQIWRLKREPKWEKFSRINRASVRNLSDEIILQIIESGTPGRTGRGDLMQLCLACKRLRRIAITHLYETIDLFDGLSLHQLLRSILQNDSLGRMVKRLNLEWGHNDPADQIKDGGSEPDAKELEGHSSVARSFTPEITQTLVRGSESAKAIALISSLPNLYFLELQPPSHCTLFDSHFARLATDGQSFPNLKNFHREVWNSKGFNFNLLLPTMLIPSLTTIVGIGVSDNDARDEDGEGDDSEDKDDEDEGEHPGAGTSNVTCLALETLNFSGRDLSRILRIPKGLRYLSLSEGEGNQTGYTSSSKEEIGRALAYTSRTLEYLWIDYEVDDDSPFGSLQGFEQLRLLSIQFELLLGIEGHNALDLARMLPQTLEQLFLEHSRATEWTNAEYRQTIERLIRAKSASSMPALNTIALEDRDLVAPLQTLAAEKSIALGPYGPFKPCFPYWS